MILQFRHFHNGHRHNYTNYAQIIIPQISQSSPSPHLILHLLKARHTYLSTLVVPRTWHTIEARLLHTIQFTHYTFDWDLIQGLVSLHKLMWYSRFISMKRPLHVPSIMSNMLPIYFTSFYLTSLLQRFVYVSHLTNELHLYLASHQVSLPPLILFPWSLRFRC